MCWRLVMLTVFAGVHVLLVACGACGRYPSRTPITGPGLEVYGSLSGAHNGYGFFAPSVASQLRARFTLTGPAGERYEEVVQGGSASEAQLRVGTILGMFQPEQLRDCLAASWAGQMLGRHPDAVAVMVEVQFYDLPAMSAYRNGDRPAWKTIYQATFTSEDNLGNPEARPGL